MNRAKIFWNLFAKKYSESLVADMKGYEKTLSDTRKHLNKDMHVLEVGCGTATTALKLADSVKEYTASDISKNMTAIGKEKVKNQNVKNVNCITATLTDNNLKKNSYDAVLAFNVFHLLKDTEGAVKEVNQLLKPGGLFISKTPCLKDSKLMIMIAFIMRFLIGPITCFTLEELKDTLKTEGFEIIDEYTYAEKHPRVFIVAKKVK